MKSMILLTKKQNSSYLQTFIRNPRNTYIKNCVVILRPRELIKAHVGMPSKHEVLSSIHKGKPSKEKGIHLSYVILSVRSSSVFDQTANSFLWTRRPISSEAEQARYPISNLISLY